MVPCKISVIFENNLTIFSRYLWFMCLISMWTGCACVFFRSKRILVIVNCGYLTCGTEVVRWHIKRTLARFAVIWSAKSCISIESYNNDFLVVSIKTFDWWAVMFSFSFQPILCWSLPEAHIWQFSPLVLCWHGPHFLVTGSHVSACPLQSHLTHVPL